MAVMQFIKNYVFSLFLGLVGLILVCTRKATLWPLSFALRFGRQGSLASAEVFQGKKGVNVTTPMTNAENLQYLSDLGCLEGQDRQHQGTQGFGRVTKPEFLTSRR